MAAETTSGFLIDGKIYEMAVVTSLSNAETQLLYERAGVTQEDFAWEANETDEAHEARIAKLVKPPVFWTTMMHIAYQRGHPESSLAEVDAVIAKVNRLEAMSGLRGPDEEELEIPLELTSEPSRPSLNDSLDNDSGNKDKSGTSGRGSTNASAVLADPLVPITTLRSATSST